MMKVLTKSFFLLFALILTNGCFRNDIRTEQFSLRTMTANEDAEKLVKAVSQIAGVQRVQPNLTSRNLTVIYDGQATHLKNIEYAIVEAGYSLPNWPAQ